MIIDCIADLHGHYPKLEGGDLLIVAGDLTAIDAPLQHLDFLEWLQHQSYKEKIVIAGNHDNFIQNLKSKYIAEVQTLSTGIKYICDSGTEFKGLKIWGSPWTRNFFGQNPKAKAFGLENSKLMKEKWCLIPENIDILITHSPPQGILDQTWKAKAGCVELKRTVCRIRPKLHVFGHIHEAHGKVKRDDITYVNASIVNEYYKPVNKPIRVIL